MKNLVFFRIHCNPSFAYRRCKKCLKFSTQRECTVHILNNQLQQPKSDVERCQSTEVLEKNTIIAEHPVYNYYIYFCVYIFFVIQCKTENIPLLFYSETHKKAIKMIYMSCGYRKTWTDLAYLKITVQSCTYWY